MLPRWLVTVKVALPSPHLPTTRRPSPKFIPPQENAPSKILRVEGAVATTLKEESDGMRRLILLLVEVNR
jgi:hypothetical protein